MSRETTNYTPGPWEMPSGPACRRVSDMFELGDFYITPPLGQTGPVAVCAGEGNARLVSAAPELLDACREAAAQFDFYAMQHDAKGTEDSSRKAAVNREKATSMRAVIAKATGDRQ